MSKVLEKIYMLFRMNVLIFVLLAITVIALLAYQNGLDHIEYIRLSNYSHISVESDSVVGGASVVQLTRTDSTIVVDYELKEGYAYPYVGLKIFLAEGESAPDKELVKGRDLSHFDSIFVWVKPRGEGSVRLYMRNYDSTFSRPGDESSLKFNEIEFFPLEETYPAVFVPNEFRVAGWWVAQNNINVHKASVDLSNVSLIEIQTGTNAPLGYGTLEIRGICFKGKVISKVNLVTILVALWFVTFLIILVIRFFDYSRERAYNKKKREELEKNLRALEIEMNDYKKSSREDPLTGCLNRAGFSSVLMREQENLNKNGSSVSFIMLDIDHFKDVNDTYGHNVGDEVLVNLSKLIHGKIRNSDSLVRWGGEEFVILCGETPLQSAQILAEKLRTEIENAQLIKQQKITCSFGVTEMIAGEDPKRLFDRADKAMYDSKENGRNRVTIAVYKRAR